MSLWTSRDAAAATGGTPRQVWTASGVSIDTRTLERGDLFVALSAARDGHEFVAEALAKGAAAALVSHVPEGLDETAPLLLVEDVLTALEGLARHARARMSGRVIAVTGSVGKTTCKEMLRTLLEGRVHASAASYNNHWGVPLTLARMPADTDFAVIEMGMNHMGEIAPLSNLARPHVAVVTTVAEAHVEGFADQAAFGAPRSLIALEKAQVFAGLESNGTAIMGAALADNVILMSVAKAMGAQVIDAGPHAAHWPEGLPVVDAALETLRDHVLVARGAQAHGKNVDVALEWDGTPATFTMTSAQEHHHFNMRLAYAAACAAGADPARAAARAVLWHAGAGRGAVHAWHTQTATGLLIDESYNANPASMRAALRGLRQYQETHQPIAILGDMKELGTASAAAHAAVMDEVAHLFGAQITVWTLGESMRQASGSLDHRQTRHFETVDDISTAIGDLTGRHAIMVKGSNSMGLSKLVQSIILGNTV